MRLLGSICVALCALIVAAVCSPAWAAVDVSFVAPEHYTDGGGKGGFRDGPTKEVVEREIRSHLVDLGARSLRPEQTLKIEILDIDLSGRRDVLGGARAEDIRVYDQLSFPRIKLRFSLEEGGHVVASGEDVLSDPLYLDTLSRAPSGDPLRYERPMLTKWFLARFAARGARGSARTRRTGRAESAKP